MDSSFFVLAAICCAYLLPSIIAAVRKHNNSNAICLTNIVFGWTILGWVIPLIWSVTDNVKEREGKGVKNL